MTHSSSPLVCLIFFALSAVAQEPPVSLQVRPGQLVDVPSFTATVAAQKCKDWAWAAALDTVLGLQGVKLGQKYWITKLHGGELCDDDFSRFEDLPRLIEGEYTREDASKVRVSASYVAGAPTHVDDLIVALRRGHPLILFWKGHAYVLSGLVYDEYIATSGQRIFEVREIKLRDPYLSGGKQFVTFVRGTDDANDINGVMQVTVTPVEQQPWQR
jgi:hypothetical protein